MLAALLLNIPSSTKTGGDDVPRLSRAKRRALARQIAEDNKRRLERYNERKRAERELTQELQAAYRHLHGIADKKPEGFGKVTPIVKAFEYRAGDDYMQKIDWLALAQSTEHARQILTAFHNSMDDDLLLILHEGS